MSDRLADASQRLEQESIALDETSRKLQAMIAEKSVVEFSDCEYSRLVEGMWGRIMEMIR